MPYTDALYNDFFSRDTLLWQDSLLFRDRRDELFTADAPAARLRPDSLHRSDTVTGGVLLSIMMVLLIVRHNRNHIKTRVANFFFPSNLSKDKLPVSGREVMRLFLAILMSLMIGLLFFAFAQKQWNIQLMTLSPVQLLGIYTLIAFLFLLFKQMMLAWVHSVFFTRAQRQLWRDDYALLFALEALLLLPLALMAIYFSLPVPYVACALAVMLLVVKVLMLVKSFAAYFHYLSASLHLILYFLAVEVMPLVILWTLLVTITISLNNPIPFAS